MKYILLIIIIILITPYHSFSEEYIIIRVCKAISGCPVNPNTGDCPTCTIQKIKTKPKPQFKQVVKMQKKKKRKYLSNSLFFNCEFCIGYYISKR